MKKKLLITTGGGDCPGLNAAISGIAEVAQRSGNWEAWGSIEAFNGVLNEPLNLLRLTKANTYDIHAKGGTILKTTNQGNPMEYPIESEDGSRRTIDRSEELVDKIKELGFEAVINIGGDGSQRLSQALFEKGLNVVGLPKTIDNDLVATDKTFGFATAAQIATESFDKLVTTAESHHRIMIMEVMGRHAGWIALHTAIAGGADFCLIPEIPYDPDKIVDSINKRYFDGRKFIMIVVSEGAKPKDEGVQVGRSSDIDYRSIKLGGVGNYLRYQLEQHPKMTHMQIRTTILGHVQRGGTPIASDRVLATAMGVKAFELVQSGKFGHMVAIRGNEFISVPLIEVVKGNKFLSPHHYLIRVARSNGISFGD